MPARYDVGGGMKRPAHIHFKTSVTGYRTLTTQMYFAGYPGLGDDDPCGSCNSERPELWTALQDTYGEWTIVLRKKRRFKHSELHRRYMRWCNYHES